jgi:maleate cis-trans isomerase
MIAWREKTIVYEDVIPEHKIGVLAPRSVIENQPYEFYRLAPPRVILVMIPMGLREFSQTDLKRITSGLGEKLDLLMERGVEIIVASGVPLPLLLGVEGHDQLLAYIHSYTGVRATSSVECVIAAAKALNVTKLVVADKWSDEMNKSLAAFFAREGLEVVGVASEPMQPKEFDVISSKGNADLALGLGRRGFTEYPEADALYIGGGSWLSQPVSEQLETEFGKPVFCNQGAQLRHLLVEIGTWHPIEGHGKLLSLP